MKANELRIGNWLRRKESDTAIQVEQYLLCASELINYSPIRLTEEWFVKFGFDKIKHIHFGYIFVHKLVKIVVYPNGMIELRGAAGWAKIEYVHSIQNLYFALMGEELTIKE